MGPLSLVGMTTGRFFCGILSLLRGMSLGLATSFAGPLSLVGLTTGRSFCGILSLLGGVSFDLAMSFARPLSLVGGISLDLARSLAIPLSLLIMGSLDFPMSLIFPLESFDKSLLLGETVGLPPGPTGRMGLATTCDGGISVLGGILSGFFRLIFPC